jgi:RNA recognition motif-containing protein
MTNVKLWIGNIAPGTSDDEIREFVKKYAPDLECKKIQRIDGDGSRPAATLEFADTPYGSVEKISMRLHGMYWKERELFVQTVTR